MTGEIVHCDLWFPGQVLSVGKRVLANLTVLTILLNTLGRSQDPSAGAVMTSGPESCPACGARTIMWGCDPEQLVTGEQIHSVVWHETVWLADTFICRTCDAGWIQLDSPGTVTWVRPY